MGEKRKDSRGRLLHNGEVQMSDGRYRFKYVDSFGKERAVYSWRLDHSDATPAGKNVQLHLGSWKSRFKQICLTILSLTEAI